VGKETFRILLGLTVLLVIAALLVGCGSGNTTPTSTPTPVPNQTPTLATKQSPPRATQPSFQVSIVPEEAYYLPGEPVEVKLSFGNISSETIALSPYPPEMQVKPSQQDNVVFSVAAGIQQPEIKPNDTITLEFSWDQKDQAGNQVSPGWYDVTFNTAYVSCTARLLIRYPQGAIEKSLDLNQSQTVNGITVTLERVELTADGSSFYVFFVPPGYTVPPPPSTGPSPPSPSISIKARAEYSIDGITSNAGLAGSRAKDDGIELVWGGTVGNLNPIPSDAKELIFTVTMVLPEFGTTPTTGEVPEATEAPPPPEQLDDWEGPWEFRIPLE